MTVLLAVYTALLVALVAAIASYQFPPFGEPVATETSPKDDRNVGTVVMPRIAGGDCRQMKFDNVTGGFQDSGVVACRGGGPPTINTNSTEGRMNSIRGAFSGR